MFSDKSQISVVSAAPISPKGIQAKELLKLRAKLKVQNTEYKEAETHQLRI